MGNRCGDEEHQHSPSRYNTATFYLPGAAKRSRAEGICIFPIVFFHEDTGRIIDFRFAFQWFCVSGPLRADMQIRTESDARMAPK